MSEYFATSAAGIESVTAAELARLGATNIRPVAAGVRFEADLATLYRAVLELRTASRVARLLREFAAITPEMLYSQVRRVRWEDYLNPQKTLAVYATIQGMGGRTKPGPAEEPSRGAASKGGKKHAARGQQRSDRPPPGGKGITHSQYAALKIKDAIVDRLRREQGARPNIDTEDPDIRVQAHFAGGRCLLSLDAAGASLHERGYRLETTGAPLKETLAAAIVDLTGWEPPAPLFDPMCGSGTLVIEAALKALRIAPGLMRKSFACWRWPDFDQELWNRVAQAARDRILPTAPALIRGSDIDPQAIRAAQANAQRAGVGHAVQFEVQDVREIRPPEGGPGVLVLNPPYGARLGVDEDLARLYREMGVVWKEHFPGWAAWVLSGNHKLSREIELHAAEKIRLYNGPLECRLLKFPI